MYAFELTAAQEALPLYESGSELGVQKYQEIVRGLGINVSRIDELRNEVTQTKANTELLIGFRQLLPAAETKIEKIHGEETKRNVIIAKSDAELQTVAHAAIWKMGYPTYLFGRAIKKYPRFTDALLVENGEYRAPLQTVSVRTSDLNNFETTAVPSELDPQVARKHFVKESGNYEISGLSRIAVNLDDYPIFRGHNIRARMLGGKQIEATDDIMRKFATLHYMSKLAVKFGLTARFEGLLDKRSLTAVK